MFDRCSGRVGFGGGKAGGKEKRRGDERKCVRFGFEAVFFGAGEDVEVDDFIFGDFDHGFLCLFVCFAVLFDETPSVLVEDCGDGGDVARA